MPLNSREQAARDFKVVDGTEAGRRVVDYLLSYCHVMEPSMMQRNGMDVTQFNEGQRSVGCEIAALLANDPARFVIDRLKPDED